jgi:hypothetical protein
VQSSFNLLLQLGGCLPNWIFRFCACCIILDLPSSWYAWMMVKLSTCGKKHIWSWFCCCGDCIYLLIVCFGIFYFIDKKCMSITKEQWFIAREYDGICFVFFKVFLGFVDNNECCNMQQSIGWLCCWLMNMLVVIGFFSVLHITDSVTKPTMISSTWHVYWLCLIVLFLCYFLLLCRQ